MNNETKIGRGGTRPNSGAKPKGIKTVTVRIDERLLNTVTEIKDKFKIGKSIDDILTKHDDAELLRKNTILSNENQHLVKTLEKEKKARVDEVNKLNHFHKTEVEHLESQIKRLERSNKILNDFVDSNDLSAGNLDSKLIKRLIQFCHPDKNPDRKELANELVQALNGLSK